MICFTAITVLISFCVSTNPVDLQVHLVGPSGPIAHFPLVAQYGGQAEIYAETDENGVAVWHLDRDIGTRVEISRGGVLKHESESNEAFDARADALKAAVANIAVPPPKRIELTAGESVISYTITCPQAIVLNVGPITNPDGSFAKLVRLFVAGDGFGSEYNSETGTAQLMGIPAITSTSVFLKWAETSHRTRAVRLTLTNSQSNLSLGAMQVPSPADCTAHLIVKRVGDTREWPARAYAGTGASGFTIVASDLSWISQGTFIKSGSQPPGTQKIDLPPGTFFVLPGTIGSEDFQTMFMDKLASGTDLSGGTIPHITIAAGETKEIEYNAVDVINAIYALP